MYALDLRGRVVLLTGATGYLGQAMADGFAAAGARLLLTARDTSRLAALQARLTANHSASVQIVAADLTLASGRQSVIDVLRQDFGQLDCLVNNAYAGRTGGLAVIGEHDFRDSHEHNVVVPFALVQSALDLLCEAGQRNAGGASVINIASMYASVSPDQRIYPDEQTVNPASYGAGKAGMVQLTRYLSCSLAQRRIRVNTISPGPFPRPELATTHPEFHRHLLHKVPLGRLGDPKELAGPVVFLASDQASYITGADIKVDGGWTAW